MLPFWWAIEGHLVTAAPPSGAVLALALANTVPAVLQHFVSLAVLALVSPVSHSIVNSCKRLVVIGLSVLYFRNPVSALNGFGMATAFYGVVLYQRSLGAEKEVFAPRAPPPAVAPARFDEP